MKYPFQPDLLDAMPETLAELFRELELTLLREICDRLKIAGELNEVTVQDIRALRSHGISLKEIKAAIARYAKISRKQIDELLEDVVERNREYYGELADLADITMPERIVSQADLDAIVAQTQGELANITQSMGFLVNGGHTKLPPAEAYQWALDNAEMEIMSGAISYSQAIDQATKQLANSGLRFVDYESGHRDHIDVAARRAVMTGINQLCDKFTQQSAEFLGTRYFEISAHSGARDKGSGWQVHKDWQGGVYYESEGGEPDPLGLYDDLHDVTGFGEVDGLEGANCRHHRFPFIPGVSEPAYTGDELKHIDDGLGCTFEGRTYSAYEATQKQREIERTIRKWERREAAAATDDERTTARIRQTTLREKYSEFSKEAGLPEQRERLNAYTPNNRTENASGKADKGAVARSEGRKGNDTTRNVKTSGWGATGQGKGIGGKTATRSDQPKSRTGQPGTRIDQPKGRTDQPGSSPSRPTRVLEGQVELLEMQILEEQGFVEMDRNKDTTHRKRGKSGQQIISQPVYNKLIEPVKRAGGLVLRGGKDVEEHLDKRKASAETIGDVIMFRQDATVSDVLEEIHHFFQNKSGMNDDKASDLRMVLNEIDAKEYLLSVAGKYKIPEEEVATTKKQLEEYRSMLGDLGG